MKKLRKKVNFKNSIIEAYCQCICSCKPYQDKQSEKYDANAYYAMK